MSGSYKFKKGDRVRTTIPCIDGNEDIHVGGEGTVVYIDGYFIGVEFDDPIREGHTCHGTKNCRDGHGWFCDKEDLELIPADLDVSEEDIASSSELAAFLSWA